MTSFNTLDHPEDGGSKLLRNVSTLIPTYMAAYARIFISILLRASGLANDFQFKKKRRYCLDILAEDPEETGWPFALLATLPREHFITTAHLQITYEYVQV